MTDSLSLDDDPRLQSARGAAIAAYAKVEHALCNLFEYCVGTTPGIAYAIFYRISSQSTRNNIVEDLLHEKFESTYDTYWYGDPSFPRKSRGGMMNLIRGLDTMRNQIVHWHVGLDVAFDLSTCHPEHQVQSILARPAVVKPESKPQIIQISDMEDFIRKADFIWMSLVLFRPIVGGAKGASAETWKQIFQQPAIYPPASDHPLAQNPKEP